MTAPGSSSTVAVSPRSETKTRPSRATKMLLGLRSRWTTPASWIACTPRQICSVMSMASDSGNR